MMKTMNQSSRCARASSSVLRYSTAFLLGAALAAAQGRITRPPVQTKQASGNQPHVATLRSSDSPEGSRVALSSDQSLNDYEAYRRGDRFYIKIPASEVPRAEALRGRGFSDVKVQRSGDSTVISFRLPPGASARVEQRSNRLEVVFTVAGAGSAVAANAAREPPRSTTGAESSRNSTANTRIAPPLSANRSVSANKSAELSRNANTRTSAPTNANKKAADRSASAAAQNSCDSNLTSKSGSPSALPSNSPSRPVATPLPTPVSSPKANPT